MKNVLVFEPNPNHLAVAGKLRGMYPAHTFHLFGDANLALQGLREKPDALITALFAPVAEGEVERLYQETYLSPFKAAFGEIPDDAGEGKAVRALYEGLYGDRNTVDSTIWRNIFDHQLEFLFGNEVDDERGAHTYYAAKHGYGGALMLIAEQMGIPSLLFTEAHRFSLEENFKRPAHGTFFLLPLMIRGIFTPQQVRDYGGDQGPRLISSAGYCKPGKDDPETWKLAMEKILLQAGQ